MVNEASPIVDTRLANGSRVNIVLQPIAIDGSAISIRKFPEQPFVMENLIRFEAITEEAAEFLKVLVLSGYNIFGFRWDRFRKNNIFKCIVTVYPTGGTNYHN